LKAVGHITSFNKLTGSGSNEWDSEGAAMMDFLTTWDEIASNADEVYKGGCSWKCGKDYWVALHQDWTSMP